MLENWHIVAVFLPADWLATEKTMDGESVEERQRQIFRGGGDDISNHQHDSSWLL